MNERAIVFFLPFIVLFIICIFVAWVVIYNARHRERLMLIEKGNPEDFRRRDNGFSFPWKKIGIIFVGVGLGIAFLRLFDGAGLFKVAMLWIIIGASFILANYLDKDKSE